MKVIFTFLLTLLTCATVSAQVSNFAGTAGKDNVYGYFSFKARPGINNQETYSTIQYGATNWMALGADYYTGIGQRYLGITTPGSVMESDFKKSGHKYFYYGDKDGIK